MHIWVNYGLIKNKAYQQYQVDHLKIRVEQYSQKLKAEQTVSSIHGKSLHHGEFDVQNIRELRSD